MHHSCRALGRGSAAHSARQVRTRGHRADEGAPDVAPSKPQDDAAEQPVAKQPHGGGGEGAHNEHGVHGASHQAKHRVSEKVGFAVSSSPLLLFPA